MDGVGQMPGARETCCARADARKTNANASLATLIAPTSQIVPCTLGRFGKKTKNFQLDCFVFKKPFFGDAFRE